MKKLKPRRASVKHAALKKNYNSKIRQEYIDIDYVDKLDDTKANCKLPNGKMVTEREYMSIFMKEWNNGGVGAQKDAKKNAIQRTKAQVKDSTDRTNKRNVDLWGQAKAMNRGYTFSPEYMEDIIDSSRDNLGSNNIEDAMVDYLDNAKELGKAGDDSNS